MSAASPFHAGEHRVQERLGARDIEPWARKVVRDHMPEEHRAFHSALPFLVAAARDDQGRPWATLLVGAEGFVTSPDPRVLAIDARPVPGDALEGALVPGADLGLLGIDLATRRRNRLNGRIASGVGAVVCAIDQTFGNCPQYIREREWRREEGGAPGEPLRGERLSAGQRAWIAGADTLFVASGYRGAGESATFGMDASHRGGDPGFVEVTSDAHLVFPDYAGNNHFNTIGNLVLDPRVGLLFVDFPTGSLLQLTGRAIIDWEPDAAARFPGARRLVHVAIEAVVELPTAVPLRWDASADSVRSLRLVEKIPESEDVTSFVLEARDGGSLPAFEAGQHLPIELEVPGASGLVRRTYSLSGAPSDAAGGRYRISVKREEHGIASRHLHDRLESGAILAARRPAGDFAIGCERCPVVLVSAGVGLTPLVSMLHSLADEDGERPVWFVHGARDGRHHSLAREVRELAARRPGIRVHTRYSRPRPDDRDHDDAGRVDGALLTRLVREPRAHWFLCGPAGFMAAVQEDLERRGVPAAHIHTESFGPKG